jgi:hypothetical protein
MQVEDFALAWQEVVFDVEAVHGFEMTAKHGGRNQIGDGGGLVVPFFDRMERRRTSLKILFVLRVPLRGAGVEIPAIEIEPGCGGEGFDFGASLFFYVQETDYYIGNLHSGVVDVILDVDFPAGKEQ